jgi:hypothetical protein
VSERKPYVRARSDTHTVTYYHSQIVVSTAIPAAETSDGTEGWVREEWFYCTHNHPTRGEADSCGSRARNSYNRFHRKPDWMTTEGPRYH